MKDRRTGHFWKNFLLLFAVYAVVVPLVFIILDSNAFYKYYRKDAGELILILAGIAIGIALIISLWQREDPELRQW